MTRLACSSPSSLIIYAWICQQLAVPVLRCRMSSTGRVPFRPSFMSPFVLFPFFSSFLSPLYATRTQDGGDGSISFFGDHLRTLVETTNFPGDSSYRLRTLPAFLAASFLACFSHVSVLAAGCLYSHASVELLSQRAC